MVITYHQMQLHYAKFRNSHVRLTLSWVCSYSDESREFFIVFLFQKVKTHAIQCTIHSHSHTHSLTHSHTHTHTHTLTHTLTHTHSHTHSHTHTHTHSHTHTHTHTHTHSHTPILSQLPNNTAMSVPRDCDSPPMGADLRHSASSPECRQRSYSGTGPGSGFNRPAKQRSSLFIKLHRTSTSPQRLSILTETMSGTSDTGWVWIVQVHLCIQCMYIVSSVWIHLFISSIGYILYLGWIWPSQLSCLGSKRNLAVVG